MASFALGVNYFKETQSIFIYSLFPLLTFLPEVLLAPILGVFIDRWDKRKAMILGHAGSGCCMVLVIFLFLSGRYDMYIILPLIALSSVFNGFVFPAFIAVTSQIVPKDQLSKSSAMLQFGFALVFIVSPALSGYLLYSLGIKFIFLIDIISFTLAIVIISKSRIAQSKVIAHEKNSFSQFRKELIESVVYIKTDPSLVITLVIIAIANFNTGVINVLITPLVLGLSNSSVLGIVLSVAGSGFLIGSALLIVMGNVKHRIKLLFLLGAVQGILFLLVLFTASVTLVAIGAFIFMICIGLIGGLNMAIWQQKVPAEIQGRVFSFRTLVLGSMTVLGFLLSGPLTQKLYLPIAEKRWSAINFLTGLLGQSPYPEIGILLLTLGFATIISLAAIYFILVFRYKQVLTGDE